MQGFIIIGHYGITCIRVKSMETDTNFSTDIVLLYNSNIDYFISFVLFILFIIIIIIYIWQ